MFFTKMLKFETQTHVKKMLTNFDTFASPFDQFMRNLIPIKFSNHNALKKNLSLMFSKKISKI